MAAAGPRCGRVNSAGNSERDLSRSSGGGLAAQRWVRGWAWVGLIAETLPSAADNAGGGNVLAILRGTAWSENSTVTVTLLP